MWWGLPLKSCLRLGGWRVVCCIFRADALGSQAEHRYLLYVGKNQGLSDSSIRLRASQVFEPLCKSILCLSEARINA